MAEGERRIALLIDADNAPAAKIDVILAEVARHGAANVRRAFRSVVRRAGLDDEAWTPRELRHSFVSILSEAGVPLEEIARLVGHRSTTVTEAVYRKQLRPVLTEGAEAMDRIFVSEGLVLSNYDVVRTILTKRASDHLPVRATIALKN